MRQIGDRLVQIGVHQYPQDQSAGLFRHVDDSERLGEMGEFRKQLLQHAGRMAQELFPERSLGIVRIERQVANRRFDKVLKEVRAKGQVRQVIASLASHFNQHRSVVDVGVGDRDAEFDVAAAAPASGTNQDELAPWQQLVQAPHRVSNIAHGGLVGELAVAFQIDVNNVGDLRYPAVGDEAVGGEDHLVGRQVLRDLNRDGVAAITLWTALQEIEVLAIVSELDVHRSAQLGLQQGQQFANPRHELCLADQAFEAENHVAGSEVGDGTDQLLDPIMIDDRYKMADLRVVRAAVTKQL